MYSVESGHTPSGCGKSEPHMILSAPSSSSSLMPMGSVWYVAQHCRFQYSLGAIFRDRSLNWSSHSASIRQTMYGIQPMPDSPSTSRMGGRRSSTPLKMNEVSTLAMLIWNAVDRKG